jgi:hypothetical protein
MKKLISLLLLICLVLNFSCTSSSKETKKEQKVKKQQIKKTRDYKKTDKTDPDVSWSTEKEELIPVNVKNEFDEEIKVKFDTNREYPVGPDEWITLGKRKPGRYTLTIYNKRGDFVDNLSLDITKKNRFVLSKDTVSNSSKITGLSTGQKVAITAGAIGAAALGTALVNKALESSQDEVGGDQEYTPPQALQAGLVVTDEVVEQNNAFAPGGKAIKLLNTTYEQATIIVEGTDGNSIGNNWVIPKGTLTQKPQPLIYNGEKITINSNQKVKAVIPAGFELQRYAFELERDLIDGNYVWVLR